MTQQPIVGMSWIVESRSDVMAINPVTQPPAMHNTTTACLTFLTRAPTRWHRLQKMLETDPRIVPLSGQPGKIRTCEWYEL